MALIQLSDSSVAVHGLFFWLGAAEQPPPPRGMAGIESHNEEEAQISSRTPCLSGVVAMSSDSFSVSRGEFERNISLAISAHRG